MRAAGALALAVALALIGCSDDTTGAGAVDQAVAAARDLSGAGDATAVRDLESPSPPDLTVPDLTAPTCGDGIHNGGESDVDCGGPCPACRPGMTCAVAADCTSGVCAGGVCGAPSCGDSVKNGDETDTDCGGAHCPPCGSGHACASGSDCAAFLVCIAQVCNPCTLSSQCAAGQVCISGACGACTQSGQCAAGLACVNGACGSCSSSSQCAGGQVCTAGACGACTSSAQCSAGQVCTGGVCTGCTSSIQCASGQVCTMGTCGACTLSSQCASGQVCLAGACGACTASSQCAVGQVCLAGACGACTASSQCAVGQVCAMGACGACTASSQCAAGKVCVGGACGACMQNADCPVAQACVAGVCAAACTHTTLVDLSGNQHTGTLRNFQFNAASGWIGNGTPSSPWALHLDGADDFIDIAPGADSLQIKDAFTEEVWTYLDVQGYQTIYTNRDGIGQYSGFHSGEFSGHWQYLFTTNGTTWNFLPSDGASQVGVWTHVVGTYSRASGKAHLYINGVPQSTTISTTAPVLYGPGALPRLGELSGAFPYHGRIAIFRIYATELSPGDVLAQFQKDAPRFGISAPSPGATNDQPRSLYFDVGNCN